MEQRRVAVEQFDLPGFAQSILAFLDTQEFEEVHPSYVIVRVAAPGGIPEYGPEEGRDTFAEELAAGDWLFFPFSMNNMGDGVPCADGQMRLLPDWGEDDAEDDAQDDVEDRDGENADGQGERGQTGGRAACDPECGCCGDGFYLGEIDCVGFLVGLRNGHYLIDAALHAGGACPGPAPSVDVTACGEFDAAMAAYVDRFIRS